MNFSMRKITKTKAICTSIVPLIACHRIKSIKSSKDFKSNKNQRMLVKLMMRSLAKERRY